MIIQTRDFGEVTIEEQDIVTFIHPILGFEDLTKYVFLFNQSICSHFVWLQSVEHKDICFILADSSVVLQEYMPILPRQGLLELGDGENIVWLIVVVDEDFSKSTVNLKSPIVLNSAQRRAMQVVLDQNYPIKYPLVQKEKGEI
ncbi:MAG: flagellar assembly protein FliW [Oscillospiraceae bacterium]